MGFLRRRGVPPADGADTASYRGTAEDEARWPALVEFLGALVWPDGTPRASGTVLIFLDGQSLKCCLSDRDASLVAFLTAPGLLELFDEVEAGLRSDRLDWRASRAAAGGRSGKK